ncbi:hypothetical protein PHET_07544 [Paragonimus heterotremus]|uniref:IC97/Casc1 N-terminal domain-containing protein n=1 Tax=Paragonimus heterotremus TaxID=100268 RepID=A0A8J4TD87_9TREM|nr:hypothetical protein PHET_07544 [Paragonimus heterotremus]
MPPKPLTKDKKKKEEEERKRQEEEARLLAEEEEKTRQLKEREERRLQKINEKEELKQRKVELDETRELLQEHRIRLEQLESERRADYAWKRYFRCDGSPNPSIEKEVNTFMSLWRLDESRLTMEEVMDESVHSLKLIDELRTLVADIGDNEEDAQTLLTYQRTMHELRQLVHEKLDRATVETLSRAVHYADHETSNLQRTWRNDWIEICIWANLSKNPRIRQFTFADVDITFDIPKFLTLSDCSFLISFMKFDNYSVECASSVPHKVNQTNSLMDTKPMEETVIKTPVPDVDVVDKVTTEEPHTDFFSEFDKMSPSEDVDETAAETEVIEPPPEDLVPTPEPDEWERAKLCSDAVDLGEYHVIGGVIRFDLLSLPRQPRSGRGWSITTCVRPPSLQPFEYIVDTMQNVQVNPEQTEVAEKKEERKDEKPPVQVKFRLPLCLVIAEEPILARWDPEVNQWRTSGIELEEFKEDENLIVLRTSVFGTMAIFQDFHINMPFQAWELRPLPFRQSKTVTGAQSVSAATNDYTLGFGETVPMTSVFSLPVYRSHTGARSTQVTTDQTKEVTNASGLEGTATEPSKDRPPNEIADQVMILGPVPTLGLSDEAYLSELPDTNQCVLTITGGLTELRLHILGERIAVLPSLPQPGDLADMGGDNTVEADAVQDVPNHHKHELTHLHGRWFTPDELITVLQLSGVNMFPREDSVCRVECLDKNPITEQRLYEQMALLSPAFAFGWSRWNAECLDRNTIIVTAVEHVDQDHSVDEDTWRVYAMTRKKVTRLNMKEYDETFDPAVDKKQPFHADFFHMFMDIGSEEAKRRVRKIDLKYFKTVKQMLQATRLVVFS